MQTQSQVGGEFVDAPKDQPLTAFCYFENSSPFSSRYLILRSILRLPAKFLVPIWDFVLLLPVFGGSIIVWLLQAKPHFDLSAQTAYWEALISTNIHECNWNYRKLEEATFISTESLSINNKGSLPAHSVFEAIREHPISSLRSAEQYKGGHSLISSI